MPKGHTVDVGTPIITVSTGAAAGRSDRPRRRPRFGASEALRRAVADTAASVTDEREAAGAVLVGYGGARARSPPAATEPPARDRRAAAKAARPSSVPAASASAVIAKPPIRKLAKDLDVDLATVTPTGPSGEVTREDVMRQASQASVFRNIQTPDWSDRARGAHPGQGRAQGDRDGHGVAARSARRT